ncbi:discoidin domain-containing protein [Aureibaculum luteum]|uniref:discoidin domain-containing protein n=1 Tax=Aureibaculum luteum TaxID=1548456 RepID=UPI002936EC83|nr:discoidin domain-containing protein [Aureibaculum luteum]
MTSTLTTNLKDKSINISLENEFPNPDIRYVLGDKNIDNKAIKYTDALDFSETTILKASLFKHDKPIGKSYIDTINIHKAFGKALTFKSTYSKDYQGDGPLSMANGIRGSKNFGDGHWQGWLEEDMEVVIDLEKPQPIKEVSIGTLQNLESGIYFPTAVTVSISDDGTTYEEIGKVERKFNIRTKKDIINFKIKFKETNTRYVKVIATNLKKAPNDAGAWLFVDELLVH